MYTAGLVVHNLIRWLVIAAGLLLLVRTGIGWAAGRDWRAPDERAHAALVGIVDLQFLAGLVLYAFLSPLPEAFLLDFPATMKVPTIRFFMLDHPVSMLIAISVMHAGRTRSRHAAAGPVRHRIVCVTTAVALAIMLASIPWAGLHYGRPLLRGL